MHSRPGLALLTVIVAALACAGTPATKPEPATSPATATTPATPPASPGPAQAEIDAGLDALRKQPGVAHVTLAPDSKSIAVRLCAPEFAASLDRSASPLPLTVEGGSSPLEHPACGCTFRGQYVAHGQGVPSLDGCNSCWCNSSGSIACTLLDCTITITQAVHFASNSAKLDEASLLLLAEVVAVLKDRPNLRRVQIVGHAGTAERGPDKLATRRAEVVRDHLVKAGVDPARLAAVGVGTTQPIGREQAPERRVEFKLDEQSRQSTR